MDKIKRVILVVDDKPEILTGISDMLRDQYSTICVTSGQAALKAIEKNMPQLFILDIEMPQMDGFELASLIRCNIKYKHTPIIFLTNKNTRDSVITAVMRGGNDYILKPVEKNALIAKICKFL